MKTVKNANLPIKVAGFLIFAAVLVYLAIYGLRLLENPYRTVQALNTTLRDSAHTRGMVVRQEEVLTSVYNTVYITAEEGKRVSGGDGLAEAFDSEEGLRRAVRMGELSQRISSLETQQNRFAAENLQQLEGERSSQPSTTELNRPDRGEVITALRSLPRCCSSLSSF